MELAPEQNMELIKVAGLVFQRFTAGHMATLQEIDSPLLRMVTAEDDESRKKITISYADLFECVFVVTRPGPESRALLRRSREAFREAACALADELPVMIDDLPIVKVLEEATIKTFVRAFRPKQEVING